jgi:hypothetical protein
MRDVVSYNVVDKEHSNPDAYYRKYEVHPVILIGTNLYSKKFLNDMYQRVEHISCEGSKDAYKEGQDKDESLVRKVLLPPGEDVI